MIHKYTEAQANFIRDNIVGKTIPELTQLFNYHFGLELRGSKLRAYVQHHGLKSGVNLRFSKGQIPFNKGKHGVTPGGIKTQFRKGHKPHNYQPVGYERVNGDYIEVKIADPNKWKAKHILIWEAHYGPVPKRHVVIFGDRNNRNFDINNLILVSRKQLIVLNYKKLIQNDADLTRTAIIAADLCIKIRKRKTKQIKELQ